MDSAYVLHSRPYRETSLLVELLTLEHGRVTVVARGAKRGKAKQSRLLQPFIPLTVSWYGDGDLVTLTNVEFLRPTLDLQGRSAICGLYVNELLVKLMAKWDPCGAIYNCYEHTLAMVDSEPQVALRKFERTMLKELGYGLVLNQDAVTGKPVIADLYYMIDPILGPKRVKESHVGAIPGASLLALDAGEYPASMLADIKRLMRVVLSHHLGNKKLVARELL